MKTLRVALVAIMVVVAPGFAQARNADVSEACRTEVQTLCPKTGDKSARRACMMEKRSQVSEGCRAEIRAARDKLRAAKRAESRPAAPAPTEN